jgi:CheY-like chemotaxis protein
MGAASYTIGRAPANVGCAGHRLPSADGKNRRPAGTPLFRRANKIVSAAAARLNGAAWRGNSNSSTEGTSASSNATGSRGAPRLIVNGQVGTSGRPIVSDPASVTILAVDDEDGMLDLAAAIFRRAGYNVVMARSGFEAIEALHDNPGITLLFTDIKMPGIDGFMLADMAKVSRPDLKVIYATGYSDEVNTKPGVRHGAILEKPYSPERLREEVRLALIS